MLEITLVMQGIQVHLIVPKNVTFGRLRSLLRELFLEHGNPLPENISLKIQDKTVDLKDSDWLRDFGVGNGDKIEIVVGEGEKSNETV